MGGAQNEAVLLNKKNLHLEIIIWKGHMHCFCKEKSARIYKYLILVKK